MGKNSHFGQKDSLSHVVEKRAEGIVSLSESHGTEVPGHISAGADAAREVAIYLLLFWTVISPFVQNMLLPLFAFALSLLIWKTARSAWLGWARLERLHRIIKQEKDEIEKNRPQEREELTALYATKGFEGALLEEVIDVLMADDDRLLKVMLEEELGLTLLAYEHPLKQSLGAFVGVLCSLLILLFFVLLLPTYGIILGTLTIFLISISISAKYEKNQLLPALVWGLAIAGCSFGACYYLLKALL